MATKTSGLAKTKNTVSTESLHSWNRWLAVVLVLEGAAILVKSATFLIHIHTSYLAVDPVQSALNGSSFLTTATHNVFNLNLAYLVAAFFFISAIGRILAATKYRQSYEADLKAKVSRLRWVEYSLSVSTMLVAVAVISGIADLSTLILLFTLSVAANLLGLVMERYSQSKASTGVVYKIGLLVGIVPWLVLLIYILGATIYGSGGIPVYVYTIFVTMFVLFGGFAANMYLQCKKKGKWSNYLYAERWYMLLSLVAETALAWQIYAGFLRP